MLTIKFLNNLTLKKCKIPCSATIMLNFIKVSIFQLSCDMMTEVISHDESHPQKLYGGKPHFPKKKPPQKLNKNSVFPQVSISLVADFHLPPGHMYRSTY